MEPRLQMAPYTIIAYMTMDIMEFIFGPHITLQSLETIFPPMLAGSIFWILRISR